MQINDSEHKNDMKNIEVVKGHINKDNYKNSIEKKQIETQNNFRFDIKTKTISPKSLLTPCPTSEGCSGP